MIQFYKEKDKYIIQDKESRQFGVVYLNKKQLRSLAVRLYREVIKIEKKELCQPH